MFTALDSDTFAGIRIVDLTRLVPGPFLTQLFSDLGAEVWKIEAPQGGDYARWYPPQVDSGEGGYGSLFAALNRGKKSIAIDTRSEDGREALARIVGAADVLVEGFRPGVLDRMGLSRERLVELNPELVVCRISGFGQDGPLARRAGHDLGYLARAGLVGLAGPAEGVPSVPPTQIADLAGGALFGAFGVAAALFRRARTGKGADLDIAMSEGARSLIAPAFSSMTATGASPERGDDLLTGGVPSYQVYLTADGRHVAVAALEPKFWLPFVQAIGLPELASDGLTRGKNGRAVREMIAERIASRTWDEWRELFDSLDACIEVVRSLEEIVVDEHVRARSAIDPGGIPVPPTSPRPRRVLAVPLHGQHTREILRSVGYSTEEVHSLEESGVAKTPDRVK